MAGPSALKSAKSFSVFHRRFLDHSKPGSGCLSVAAKDARGRAENILTSAGNTSVGKLVYADMGVININPANSTNTSNEGNNDTSSYEKDIITIVHAEYQVK